MRDRASTSISHQHLPNPVAMIPSNASYPPFPGRPDSVRRSVLNGQSGQYQYLRKSVTNGTSTSRYASHDATSTVQSSS